MKILLTGATGFIGSHLAPLLEAKGHELFCLERYVTGRPASIHKFKTIFGDLRSYFHVSRVLDDVKPQVVIHLASISPVSYSYESPFDVQETNYLGTVYLAEACLRKLTRLQQFIFASSSETYGNIQSPMSEDDIQVPNSPYSVSKVAAEKYLIFMNKAYNFPVTIIRPFNTYGRKNDRHFFIEKALSQMLASNRVLLGDPDAIRDFLYVDDHVSGYLSAIENQESIGEAINVCTGLPYKLTEIIEIMKKLTNFSGEIVWHTIPKRPYDIKELWGTNQKAKQILNWTPKFLIEGGLKLTISQLKEQIQAKVI